MKVWRPGLVLVGILLIGAGLRFWHLDAKPLWMDEVITALFSLGQSYDSVPLDRAVPLSTLGSVFQFEPATSCNQIRQTVATQSVHPPLFFCWLHQWFGLVQGWPQSWVWKLRAFPALLGVGAIAVLFWLNRVAFSVRAGLMAAALMAVSPFALYLSQEARHYTLPMLLVALALVGVVQIQQRWSEGRSSPGLWVGWVALNGLGFYVHYFFILAFIAQVGTLLFLAGWIQPVSRRRWGELALAIGAVLLIDLPWLPTFVSHLSRPETDWLEPSGGGLLRWLAPFYQLPVGWLSMVVAFPVENQPLWKVIISGLLMAIVALWLVFQSGWGLRRLGRNPAARMATLVLACFTGGVLLEFLAIVYLLGKDLTLVPRYNFIYYPAVCALLGAIFTEGREPRTRPNIQQSGWGLLLVGLLSCSFVLSDLAFQKPYNPDQVVRDLGQAGQQASLVVMGYHSLQDVALGLSFALALEGQQTALAQPTVDRFAFLATSAGYPALWATLAQLPLLGGDRLEPRILWAIAPGLRRRDYPPQLSLPNPEGPTQCQINPDWHYRIGIPYQGYTCKGKNE